MQVEGGSVGFQIGASDTDVVLLVMNDGGMRHVLSDKFTIGGEATAAAGPIGRDAAAETDAEMQAEMLSYSRSHGLFAGISLEGATLRPDRESNRELYGRDATNREILTGDFKTPAVAYRFEHALDRESARRSPSSRAAAPRGSGRKSSAASSWARTRSRPAITRRITSRPRRCGG